ncbi:hypothetical protein EV130_102518 [Rhizobium azibense]|uniref:Uncharacterized protein n=1 Tax=Rhizobium azibense TaxID=1136135 RepID=A0A4R3RT62_9HYPH|nr:hypothetical protein EV130_102518 [Rhizobium azibense]TCU37977.1 hypothetical protein EV129_105296 [Rhizobium azibense]
MKRFGTDRQHGIGFADHVMRYLTASSTAHPQLVHSNGGYDRSNFNDICVKVTTTHNCCVTVG